MAYLSCAVPFLRGSRARNRGRGFTLVELVVVLIVLGVLAVVAIPRLRGVDSFNTMGFADRVMAGLRYAQKQAIAKRRNVCVVISGTTVTFTYAASGGAGSNCTVALTGPAGQSAFAIAPEKSGLTLAASSSSFAFDALGRPISATAGGVVGAALSSVQTITVTGDGSRTFSVEPETGYVHT